MKQRCGNLREVDLIMAIPEIFIGLHEFDVNRLVIGEVQCKELGKGNQKTKYHYSEAFYKNDNGELCKLFFQGPSQEVWGFNEVYPFTTPESDRNPSVNLKGFQVAYPITIEKTVNTPTKDEEYIKLVFDNIMSVTAEALKKECTKKKSNRKVPQITVSQYNNAKSDGNIRGAVKKIYDFPNKKGTKIKNTEKPMRAYIKLLTSGLGSKLTCDTKIFGPGDKQLSPRTLATHGQRGLLMPVFTLEGLYWGQHGNESPYGVSARIFLDQCNYTPGGTSRGSTRRFLPSNTDEVQIDSDDEDSSFPSPTGNGDFQETDEHPLMNGETNDLSDSNSEEESVESPKQKPKKPRRKQIKKTK